MRSDSPQSSAKAAVWDFSIWHARRPDGDVRACGSTFYTDTAEEIHELAKRSGLKVMESPADKWAVENGAFPVQTWLRVLEPEDSKALHEIIDGLRSSYGIDLARISLITNEKRYFFRIRKLREFAKHQIEDASYLCLKAKTFQIGTWSEPTDDEYSRGIYAVENDSKQGTKVQFGFLSPFPAMGVDQQLKEELERQSLVSSRSPCERRVVARGSRSGISPLRSFCRERSPA